MFLEAVCQTTVKENFKMGHKYMYYKTCRSSCLKLMSLANKMLHIFENNTYKSTAVFCPKKSMELLQDINALTLFRKCIKILDFYMYYKTK